MNLNTAAPANSLAVSVSTGLPLLDSSNMKPRNRDAAVVIKPNDHPTTLRVRPTMICCRDWVTATTGGDNCEWLKWDRFQVLANISNHDANLWGRSTPGKCLWTGKKRPHARGRRV